MSDCELLDKQWVHDGVEEINKAVGNCNTHFEPDRPIRLAWGSVSLDEQRNEMNYQGVLPHVESGCLQWNGRDCELHLSRVSPLFNDRESCQATLLEIELCLERPPVVPSQIDHKALIGLAGPRNITAKLCRNVNRKGKPERHMVVFSLYARLSVDGICPSRLMHILNDLAFI